MADRSHTLPGMGETSDTDPGTRAISCVSKSTSKTG